MKFSHTAALAVMILFAAGQVKAVSDADLLSAIGDAIGRRHAAKGGDAGVRIMHDSLRHLNDAEKTRAMALGVYELDKDRQFGMRHNSPHLIKQLLREDPSLITDPTELKAMIATEADARKFYILSSMASELMRSIKGADFIPEMSPMLYRNEPLAKMGGEYVFERLQHASFFAYDIIVENLRALDADFIPPDVNLPYPERIPILAKWLRENWKGCERLGLADSPGKSLPAGRDARPATMAPTVSENGGEVSRRQSAPWSFWAAAAGVLVLLAALIKWRTSPRA